jgi:hypothetical protein
VGGKRGGTKPGPAGKLSFETGIRRLGSHFHCVPRVEKKAKTETKIKPGSTQVDRKGI